MTDVGDAGRAALIRRKDRVPRTIAKVVIGVAAGVATFALLLVLLDTDPQPTEDVAPPTDASGNAS